MKAVLISCFNYYDNRLKHVERYLINMGYEAVYITSDFDHISKQKYNIESTNTVQIKVKPYYKNMSIQRLLSHHFFAKQVFKKIETIKPDLVYVMFPPNSLVKSAADYRKKNDVKMIFDVYDLWPESFPMPKYKGILSVPFRMWAGLRDKNLKYADVVVTECELYQEKLQEQLREIKTNVLYLTKERSPIETNIALESDQIDVCYLGSINSLIDIETIVALLNSINNYKRVILHVVGDGEKRNEFIDKVRNKGIHVEYHGKIYEEETKREIFDQCYFGINVMKDSVSVGLTMKSIDYFQASLPILNTIQGDTKELVEKYGIGLNITSENISDIAEKIANMRVEEILKMRNNTRVVFDELFSLEAFNKRLEVIISSLEK